MKITFLLFSLSIAGCANEGFVYPIVDHERKFTCDMDPLKQNCAGPRAYEQYMRTGK